MLACGADRAYPAAHRNLIDYIADVGLVVSEAAPGCAPTRIRFLARNRVIAAMPRGVVVVEAAVRSGALNTASWAAGLGRTVMGVPGPGHQRAVGRVHQLIRARDALLVTSGEEVLEAVGPIGTFTLADPREPETPARPTVAARAPGARRGATVRAVDSGSIARTAGIAHSRTKEALLACTAPAWWSTTRSLAARPPSPRSRDVRDAECVPCVYGASEHLPARRARETGS